MIMYDNKTKTNKNLTEKKLNHVTHASNLDKIFLLIRSCVPCDSTD